MDLLEILKQTPCLPYCSYCKRGVNLNGSWIYLSVEEGIKVGDLMNISHGACPLCYNEVRKEIEIFKLLNKKV